MQEFVMMIGLPASGKDTLIHKDDYFQDFVEVSSDQIRKDNGYNQGEIKNVFDICRKNVVNSLTLGQNVVFNATNLSRKHRINLLNHLHQKFDNVRYIAYVMITPFKVCIERNAGREGFNRVPDEIMNRMIRTFQIPMKGEGFDYIFYYADSNDYCYEDGMMKWNYFTSDFFFDFYDFDQDNPYHTLSLGDHMDKTYDYIVDHIEERLGLKFEDDRVKPLLEAALYHDIGKLVTKDYHDAKGNPSKTAHYYGHENAGAYIVLSEFPFILCRCYNDFDSIVKIATYINFHMRVSFTWRNYPNGKAAKREKNYFNDFDLKCLELLGEADRQAH